MPKPSQDKTLTIRQLLKSLHQIAGEIDIDSPVKAKLIGVNGSLKKVAIQQKNRCSFAILSFNNESKPVYALRKKNRDLKNKIAKIEDELVENVKNLTRNYVLNKQQGKLLHAVIAENYALKKKIAKIEDELIEGVKSLTSNYNLNKQQGKCPGCRLQLPDGYSKVYCPECLLVKKFKAKESRDLKNKRTAASMISGTFTRKAQDKGISLLNISSGNTEFLRSMIGNPIPMTPKKSPTGGNNLGPLIRHGLAKLSDDRKHYEITPKGEKYLADVDVVMK